jgi:hypothetical protein
MVELFVRWSMSIVLAIFAAVAWSAMCIGAATDTPHAAPAQVAPEDLPLRASSELAVDLGDPCKLDAHVVPSDTKASAPRAGESRVLTLESILAFPGGSQANICGQAISVGRPIHGVDMDDPPVLSWIDGVRVGVRYKGRELVLDLDRAQRVSLDATRSGSAPTAKEKLK